MKLLPLLSSLMLALPVGATPGGESMVQVPGLEYLGPSRLSTVEHCEVTTELNPYELLTDEDFDVFEGCIIDAYR
jgi:hypothetical protein